MPPMPVTTGVATLESAPQEVDVVGTLEASSRVEIKSQVAGQIESIKFTEGQDVTDGQLLVVIDKHPYEDALHQAQAAVDRDQAQITQAQAATQRDDAQARSAATDAKRYRAGRSGSGGDGPCRAQGGSGGCRAGAARHYLLRNQGADGGTHR